MFFWFFLFFALFIDLLTDKVQPLSRCEHQKCPGDGTCHASSKQGHCNTDTGLCECVPSYGGEECGLKVCPGVGPQECRYVKSVFIIHVGGTRCVPSSTDNILNINARITLTVEVIRRCIFIFLFDV